MNKIKLIRHIFFAIFSIVILFFALTYDGYDDKRKISDNQTASLSPIVLNHGLSNDNVYDSIMGYNGLYYRVRDGDNYFISGEYFEARYRYEKVRDNLRILHDEYPKRAKDYRDAERVVQSRLFLVETASMLAEVSK